MISHLLWIIVVAVFIFLFWQQRRQSETARRLIEKRCQQLNLQVISIARGSHQLSWFSAPFSLSTRYYFEFSVNGFNCFQGYALMKGNYLQELYIPPYPV